MLIFLIGALFAAYTFYRDVVGATITDTVIVGKFEVPEYQEREWVCNPFKKDPDLWKCQREIQIGFDP